MRVNTILLLALFLTMIFSVSTRAEYIDVIDIIGSIDKNGTLHDYSLYHGTGQASYSHDKDDGGYMFKFSTYDSQWNLLRETYQGFSFYLSFGAEIDLMPFQISLPSSEAHFIAVLKDDSIVYVIDLYEYVCAGLCTGCDNMGFDCDEQNITIPPSITEPVIETEQDINYNMIIFVSVLLLFIILFMIYAMWRNSNVNKDN